MRGHRARYSALAVAVAALAGLALVIDSATNELAGPAALHAARAARRADDLPAAARHLAAAERAGADSHEVAFERALLLAQHGRTAEALPGLMRRLADGPEARELVWEALGRGHLRAYRLLEARVCFDVLLRVNPDSLTGLVGRAETYRQAPREPWGPAPEAEAVPDLRRAFALAPGDLTIRLRLAEGLAEGSNADRAEAETHLRVVMALRPCDPEAPTRLARLFWETSQRHDEAAQLLNSVLEAHPRHVSALIQAALYLDDQARAAALFERALAADPFDRRAIYACVVPRWRAGASPSECKALLERFQEVVAAEKELEEARDRMLGGRAEANPGAAELRVRAGRAALRLGRTAEARLWFERARLARSWRGQGGAGLAAAPDRGIE